MIKKFFAIIIVFILLFGLAGFVFAQGRELEVDYPEIEGEQPEETTTPVPEYFKYIFNFLIWISGLIALVVLVYAGFQYFTSAGNPEAMNDAKSRIGAALLGILILFGSYLILTTINPDLIVFHLPRLRPIMSELPSGVLVCKEQPKTADGNDAVVRARKITVDFKYKNPSEEQMLEWKKESDILLDDIALKCYTITTAGDIRGDFDNKVGLVYFIPSPPTQKTGRIVQYGAVLYEERNYGGNSKTYAKHFDNPGVTIYDIEVKELTNFQLSSIKPFNLLWPTDPNWKVILYQEYNYDKNFPNESYQLISPNLRREIRPLPFSPKSMRIVGDLLIVFIAKDPKTQESKSEVFFAESDANLEDNLNIVEWVNCKDYESEISKQCEIFVPGSMGPGGVAKIKCCAQAAATIMRIISAKIY